MSEAWTLKGTYFESCNCEAAWMPPDASSPWGSQKATSSPDGGPWHRWRESRPRSRLS